MKTIIALIGILIMSATASLRAATAADSIIGDWFAQIDIPQNELTILMEINIADSENCTVKCTWTGGFPTEEESGKAKYRFDGKQLTVIFLNEEERIATDNIFGLENVYDVSLAPDRLVILKNRQFRGVDVNFGRGYQNRGFAKIIFGD